jgi:hypothetical protein
MIFDHLAIQVLNGQVENTVKWYMDFFKCKKIWQQSSDFEDLTRRRLIGIDTIVELKSSFFRFHIFSRPINNSTVDHYIQYHHIGFSVDKSSKLTKLIQQWHDLRLSNKYTFYKDAYVTEHIKDTIGVESIYFTDVNGLEYEVTYVPENCKTSRIYPNTK